jgi:hypothetical protein
LENKHDQEKNFGTERDKVQPLAENRKIMICKLLNFDRKPFKQLENAVLEK